MRLLKKMILFGEFQRFPGIQIVCLKHLHCRYMSVKENKYIRYFGGHDKKVVTLAMSPTDDTFLSGSMDKSIRLWDLRSNHCQVLH